MHRSTILSHFGSDPLKLTGSTLACPFFIKVEARLFRKRRAVFPYVIDKIDHIFYLNAFSSQNLLVLLSLSHGQYSAVKSHFPPGWYDVSQPLSS